MKFVSMISFVTVILILSISTPIWAKKSIVTIATTGETAPANTSNLAECTALKAKVFKTKDGRSICGFEVELIEEVCAIEGLKCQWVIQSFGPKADPTQLPDILNNLTTGNRSYDLAINFMRGTTGRMLALNASSTYYEGHPSLYTSTRVMGLFQNGEIQKNANNFPLPKAGGKIKIAGAGYYEQEIKARYTAEELNRVQIVQVAALDEQFKKLTTGEVDFVFGADHQRITFEPNGFAVFEAKPISTLSNTMEKGSRVYASPDAQGVVLIGKVNAGLAKLKTNGKYDQIFNKYLIKNAWGCVNGPRLNSTVEECKEKAALEK
jgi:ABC-type amino acid transport substrate-binding protein